MGAEQCGQSAVKAECTVPIAPPDRVGTATPVQNSASALLVAQPHAYTCVGAASGAISRGEGEARTISGLNGPGMRHIGQRCIAHSSTLRARTWPHAVNTHASALELDEVVEPSPSLPPARPRASALASAAEGNLSVCIMT